MLLGTGRRWEALKNLLNPLQAYKNGDRGQTYSFTRVFDEDTPQQEYFDSTAAPLVSAAGCGWAPCKEQRRC